jgi:SH3-like domain-containing protein
MKSFLVRILAILVLIVGIGAAKPLPTSAAPEGTGLPLPRFVSLRANEVNLRTGPDVQHPIEWIFRRQNLPVEIIAEYKTWRKVRDWQGTQGWIHQSMVAGKRTIIVTGNAGSVRTLRTKADANSPSIARIEAKVIGKLLSCPGSEGWCRVEIDGFKGWLRRVEFWGVHRNEVLK